MNITQERAGVSKRITSEESKLEQLRAKLHEVLQTAKVEEVALPLLGEGEGEGESRGHKRARRGGQEGEEGSEDTSQVFGLSPCLNV